MARPKTFAEIWTSPVRSTQSTAEHLPVSAGTLHFCAEATAYSEPDDSFTTGMANRANHMEPREEIAHIPKSNRMPDAPHSVKVETQVMDGV
jgi:hypothetical protein